MTEIEILKQHYETFDEESRLLSRHGQVEYLTTMKYIHACAKEVNAKSIVEVGAGTGRYSVALAKEGFNVTAVELIEHNLEVLRSMLNSSEPITALQGNALDLSQFADGSFDMTLLLGPMYHLFTFENKKKALSEAVRVTKQDGYIMVAYCMNEPTIINFGFRHGNLQYILNNNLLLDEWHCKSEPKEIFELYRTEDIAELDATVNVTREKLIATDGATNYMRDIIDGMDNFTFEKWMEYHFAICERHDLIGASHHTLDILRKN
ncbi:MAG: class I SAM-dependent methyltransferase [Clostridia bacterium]|nr:class I SAM-dependent methyltransferase [Clostridia bacterium]